MNSSSEETIVPKKVVGRPKGKKARKALYLSLEVDTHERLEKLAENNHMTKAAVVNYLIWHCGLVPSEIQEGDVRVE